MEAVVLRRTCLPTEQAVERHPGRPLLAVHGPFTPPYHVEIASNGYFQAAGPSLLESDMVGPSP